MLVFTTLKNADLVAISAEIALKETLGVTRLKSLSRYSVWDIDAEADLGDVLEKSYYLLNPNKESYSLGSVSLPSTGAEESAYFLKVSSRQTEQHSDLISQIRYQFGVEIRSISRFTLWQIVVSGTDQDVLHAQIEKEIAISRNFSQGLLVNPVLDEYKLMHAEVFSQGLTVS